MKKLLFLALALVLILTSCERKSGKKPVENTKVVLTDGTNHAVTLPIKKIGKVNVNYDLLRARIVVASANTRNSCKYTYSYKPYDVFVETSKFDDNIIYIRYHAKNSKGETVNMITSTVFLYNEVYEFYVDELKVY